MTAPSTPGVVRRAVTRRGNLLPKTKGFARIRAALAEEATPVDTDTRREAETIRQVRERDNSTVSETLEPSSSDTRPGTGTAASSPCLLPAVPESAQEDFGRDLNDVSSVKGLGMSLTFATHASRNSGGMEYWNRFDRADPTMRTPPPPNFARQSSSVMSSDMNIDSPSAANGDMGMNMWGAQRSRARSSASDASEAFATTAPSAVNDDVHLKKFKRRREDDFDIATIKRRAVSPGLSAQNSPVLTNSPSQRDVNGGVWGLPPEKKDSGKSDGSLQAARSNSGGSLAGSSLGSGGTITGMAGPGKKLGLQGMVDTNDGLMKMSIE